jgi:hypothetical protein
MKMGDRRRDAIHRVRVAVAHGQQDAMNRVPTTVSTFHRCVPTIMVTWFPFAYRASL